MFNEVIVQNFTNPHFAEEIAHATQTIELGNPVCGDRIKVQLQMDGDTILIARYQAWGCATSLATGNIFCARVEGLSLSEITQISAIEINSMLGELMPSQNHCLEMLHALFESLVSAKETIHTNIH